MTHHVPGNQPATGTVAVWTPWGYQEVGTKSRERLLRKAAERRKSARCPAERRKDPAERRKDKEPNR